MIADNLKTIRQRLHQAAQRAGRQTDEISLMVVSKTQPIEKIQEVYDAGIRLFGENRVAEAADKFSGRFPGAEVHLIGHIQRNKARQAVEIASCIQSLDSEQTLNALAKQASSLDRSLDVLIEIHTTDEESKLGVRSADDAFRLIELVLQSKRLNMKGLMTMAPFTRDESPIRRSFRSLYDLKTAAAARFGEDCLSVLSMGMTNDFEIAVEEGSTLVRIGTAVFGARN